MSFTRRSVLKSGSAAAIAFTALACGAVASGSTKNARFKLEPDPDGLLDLPEGFSYKLLNRTGGEMSDGFLRPGRPDGMACFAHPKEAGKLVLIRNHENWPNTTSGNPFGPNNERLDRLKRGKLYNVKPDGTPFFGGTTNVIVDADTLEVEKDFLSLIGTTGNCAGGATPWGSWLSCEEAPISRAQGVAKDHGFVYEVPAGAKGPVDPKPLKAMGRFAHEACSVDPASGIVYMTEDQGAALFYRFIPDTPGDLAKGGTLQALVIDGWEQADTRNWPADWSTPHARTVTPGQQFATRWITLDEVEAPAGDLAARGTAAGAAIFCRGEGLAFGREEGGIHAHYFNCTQGGKFQTGQVWRYRPGADEGTASETPGTLTLLYESPDADTLDLCDNLAVTPWGDLMLCEDGRGDNYLRGLTTDGTIYDFARNAHEMRAEFCGACFSPDGRTLFVNVQEPGMTYAITGPWERLQNIA